MEQETYTQQFENITQKIKQSKIYNRISFYFHFLKQLYNFLIHEKFIQGNILKKGFSGNYLNKLVPILFQVQKWILNHLNQIQTLNFSDFKSQLTDYNIHKYEDQIYYFYQLACERWKNLEGQNIEQMKFAMLEIVADTVAMQFEQPQYFGDALFDIIVMLMEKKHQKISKDILIKNMKDYLGILFKNDRKQKKACYEYYEFSRNFALVEFPQHQTRLVSRSLQCFNFGKMVLQTIGYKFLYVKLVVADYFCYAIKIMNKSYIMIKISNLYHTKLIVKFLKENKFTYKLRRKKLIIKIDKYILFQLYYKIKSIAETTMNQSQSLYQQVKKQLTI